MLVVGLELNYGLLLGSQDFFVYNVLRLAQPLLMAVSFVVLWWLDALTVESALIGSTAGTGLVLAIGMARAVRRIGVGPPDFRLGLTTLWYGVRGQGSTVASNVTARLDVAMLPAFVSRASVGLYSVATNVSLIVYQLSNTFAALVLPAAARDPERGPIKVVGSLWASLAIAAVLALGSRCSRGRCWASCTATTSATRRSRCCCSYREPCCSPARRSWRPACTRPAGRSRPRSRSSSAWW